MVNRDEVARLVRIASALREQGRFPQAEAAYQSLLAAAPEMATAWYNLAFCQRQRGRNEAALESYQRAIVLGLRGAEEAHLNRAVILTDSLRRDVEAETELKRALALNPTYVPALMNLANLAEDYGRQAEAKAHYLRVLSIEPKRHEALARYANLLADAGDVEAIAPRLENALEDAGATSEERASLAFALGRAFDRLGRFDAAFAVYKRANALSLAAYPGVYNRKAIDKLADEIEAVFDSARQGASPSQWAPIFICGMFRSGSTLVEQVLAGHQRITPCGELSLLPGIANTRLSPFPARAASLDEAQWVALAAEYESKVRRLFPRADLVTDKWLSNFFYIGAIKRMFPAAKIVHTVRDPLDNILSVYFLHLDSSFSYARDLSDTAHQLAISRRLMRHWRSLYPNDIIDFNYDSFVSQPRETAQTLVDFLGLPWDESCLAFQERKNAVKTASVWQVRQPLYASSSGRWRNYEPHLATIQEEVAAKMAP